MGKQLRLILGDQLNIKHSWFETVDNQTLYVIMEVRSETDYVKHHIQKVVSFFAAMRAFAKELENLGHKVMYIRLDDPSNLQAIDQNIKAIIEQEKIQHFEYQYPDEYRLDEILGQLCKSLPISTQVYSSEHFFTTRYELGQFFQGKKTYLLESFYRQLRRKHDILMDGDLPFSGVWNYDQENRKKLPSQESIPEPFEFENDVSELVELIFGEGVETIGNISGNTLGWPITREQTENLLAYFTVHLLSRFGKFQDAMTKRSWSVFHSRLSFGMNAKLISPKEVVSKAIAEWQRRPDEIDIAQIEGFIRQILGWREYMRGVYWAHMPDYAEKNFFGHDRKLPGWFWTGETKMDCMSHAIKQSLDYAYAHHIQRLMVTGNFALLAGIDPDEIDQWYLGIYIDAIEWVEITNTRGMSQFADGGIVGTKPYVSSANYINKMSHYCKDCYYDPKQRVGEKACPFNSLYWHFFARNAHLLEKNPRIGMAYRLWNKMDAPKQRDLLDQANAYLDQIESL